MKTLTVIFVIVGAFMLAGCDTSRSNFHQNDIVSPVYPAKPIFKLEVYSDYEYYNDCMEYMIKECFDEN